MIKLTKKEILAVSGGDMFCYCMLGGGYVGTIYPKFDVHMLPGEGKYERQERGDVFAGACKTVCCDWPVPLYAGWIYNGTDIESYVISEPFEIKTRPLADSSYC